MTSALCSVIPIGIVILIFFLASNVKQVNEYESGVVFTFGKFSKVLNSGWHILLPTVQKMIKVDMRLKAVEVEGQEAMSKDNVSVNSNAVIYYKITDAAKSVIDVENVHWAVAQLAQTTLRNVIGEFTLDDVLSEREKVSEKIEELVNQRSDKWGVTIENVELKDIVLPTSLKRTMAKVAEAERERNATILKSKGEVEAAKNLAKAGEIMKETSGAMHLRTLNALNDISSDQSNTIVFALPLQVMKTLEAIGDNLELDIIERKSKGKKAKS